MRYHTFEEYHSQKAQTDNMPAAPMMSPSQKAVLGSNSISSKRTKNTTIRRAFMGYFGRAAALLVDDVTINVPNRNRNTARLDVWSQN